MSEEHKEVHQQPPKEEPEMPAIDPQKKPDPRPLPVREPQGPEKPGSERG
jgi:hypothetical protein